MTASSGWYVYGVVPAAEASEALFADVAGVAGGPVTIVERGELAAIASEVPLSEFGEEAIVENLREPAWLEARVRAHERVLETALRDLPVVPFRFGTIYRSEEHVREMLGAEERLSQTLERVRGRFELGVKGFLVPASADPEQGGATSGRQYLEQKQRARQLAEELDARKAQWAEEAHARLAASAEAAAANALQPREVTPRDEEMFLNGAYLVAADREQEFRAALAQLESEFGRFELTGPWPPYNFVEEAEPA